MSTTLSPDRATFRALVADVAARAKEKLPQAVNGRVESAVKLVLMGDVQPQTDGTILVGSSSDPSKTYVLVGHACDCQDFAYKAPHGWCCHRIAAGIAKRVGELLPPEAAPELPAVPLAPLGEAPASVNCHIMLEGRQIQLTLRDTDESRLLERLATVLRQYPNLPQHAAKNPRSASGEAPDKGQPDWCAVHNVQMRFNEGKDGRKGWHSHRSPEGRWCHGK